MGQWCTNTTDGCGRRSELRQTVKGGGDLLTTKRLYGRFDPVVESFDQECLHALVHADVPTAEHFPHRAFPYPIGVMRSPLLMDVITLLAYHMFWIVAAARKRQLITSEYVVSAKTIFILLYFLFLDTCVLF